MAQEKKQGKLTVHAENIFPIIKKWLYSEHDIFLRELIANAIDAMNKREAMDSNVKKEDLQVEVKINKRKKALEISDNGIGFPVDLDFRNTESLGMRIVISLTEQLNGTIELDRTDGTEFKIRF